MFLELFYFFLVLVAWVVDDDDKLVETHIIASLSMPTISSLVLEKLLNNYIHFQSRSAIFGTIKMKATHRTRTNIDPCVTVLENTATDRPYSIFLSLNSTTFVTDIDSSRLSTCRYPHIMRSLSKQKVLKLTCVEESSGTASDTIPLSIRTSHL